MKRKEENQISLWERIKNVYGAWLNLGSSNATINVQNTTNESTYAILDVTCMKLVDVP